MRFLTEVDANRRLVNVVNNTFIIFVPKFDNA